MTHIHLSLIVPVYNVESYISKCLNSILAQNCNSFEVILVDDGSSDKSIEVAKKLIGGDPRFQIIHKENGGLSSARNAGIVAARGDYLLFIDSDDYISSNLLEILKEMISNDSNKYYDIIHFPIIHITEQETEISRFIPNTKRYYQENDFLLAKGSINYSVCNKLFRRNLFNNIRFPESQLIEDKAIIHKLLYNCHMIEITTASYFYVKHSGTITRSFNKKFIDDYFKVFNSYCCFSKKIGNIQLYYEAYMRVLIPLLVRYLCINSRSYRKDSKYMLDKVDKKLFTVLNIVKYGRGMQKYLSLLFRIHPYLVYLPMKAFLKITHRD